MSRMFINLINIYQRYLSFDTGLLAVLAPGGACRMSPSCSEYTMQTIKRHGLVRGLWLGGRRMLACR